MKVPSRARAGGFAVIALLIGVGVACSTGGQAKSTPPVVVFDSGPPAGWGHIPSEGFECCQVKEFGDEVQFAGSARRLTSATVTMVNWARHADYPTSPDNDGFMQGLKLNLYKVGPVVAGHPTLGALIRSVPTAVKILWQPDNDPNCPGDATEFYTTGQLGTTCYHGIIQKVTFNLPKIPVPNQIVWSIYFDTETYGNNPIGVHGPYDSLNVGAYGNGPSVGSDPEPGVAWLSGGTYPYCDGGAGGTWTFRPDEGCNQWAGYTPVISFSATV
jgi:hypothetical protein